MLIPNDCEKPAKNVNFSFNVKKNTSHSVHYQKNIKLSVSEWMVNVSHGQSFNHYHVSLSECLTVFHCYENRTNTVFRQTSPHLSPLIKPSLHVLGFGDDAVGVTLLKSSHHLRIQQVNAIQLVSESYPAGGGGRRQNQH